jgi:hypothetical protein
LVLAKLIEHETSIGRTLSVLFTPLQHEATSLVPLVVEEIMPAYGRDRATTLPAMTPGCIRSWFEITSRNVPFESTMLMRSTVISPKCSGAGLRARAATPRNPTINALIPT